MHGQKNIKLSHNEVCALHSQEIPGSNLSLETGTSQDFISNLAMTSFHILIILLFDSLLLAYWHCC